MGLGSTAPRRKIYFCAIKQTRTVITGEGENKKEDKVLDPHIEVSTYNESGVLVKLKDEKAISGYLLKITDGYYEYKGKRIAKIAMHLVDQNEEFKVEMNQNNAMARSLMNKIIALHEEIGWIELRVYVQKGKDGKQDNAGMWLGNNGTSMNWKYQYKRSEHTQPDDTILADMVTEAPDPQDSRKMQKIYHQLNEFLLKDWREFAHVVTANAKTMQLEGSTPPPPGPPKPVSAESATATGQASTAGSPAAPVAGSDHSSGPGSGDQGLDQQAEPPLSPDPTDDLPF